MAKCVDITPTRKKICVGALRYRISINDRDAQGLTSTDTAHSETFTLFKTVKASVETKPARTVLQTWDGVVIDPDLITTHVFMTRFLAGINTEQYITFKGNNYKILKAENIDEANLWLKLNANFRGDSTKAGAQ